MGFHIGILRCIIELSKNIKKIPILSENGNVEMKQWKALEKYMKEYSLLKEKNVPDIVLWEKFLVYATTFGISKQVIKQLKMVHPEMFEMDNAHMHRCAYWYMISDPRYGDNYFNNFNSGLSNVYSSASSAYSIAHSSSSSGSGSGGGFSGGGGGRRRRRRLRRSMKFRDARKVSFSY